MFQQNWGIKNFSAEEGDITIFCWNFFSHSAKKYREGNHSMFQKYAVMEKFYEEEGDITIFRWNFFFSQCRKIS